MPYPIPYQGSKRKLAKKIVTCLPVDTDRLFEPFCGSAAISIAAAASTHRPRAIRLNDSNEPLALLWQAIIERPETVADAYEELWSQQLGCERSFYDEIRSAFNRTHEPELLLYLLARCVKAAVRYNAAGEFNQSPDNRRLGCNPARMRCHVGRASELLRYHTTVTAVDYVEALVDAAPADVVYMDPPYQGVSTRRDRRYRDIVGFDDFVDVLADLNRRCLSFIVSYDGRCGDRIYGQQLPDKLRLTHLELDAGRSTQATLIGKASVTIESLYLSSAIVERLGGSPL